MKLEDNTILLVPSNVKEIIIKEVRNNNPFINIKFMDIKEFIRNYYFNYDNKSIYYLMNKYNYKYDVALKYIKNLYYIKDEYNYKEKKLIKLVDIKKELIENDLLKPNNLFREYIKNKKIVVYGFDSLDKLEKDTLLNIDAEIIYNKEGNYKNNIVYEFDTMESEVNYLAISIISLLNRGIDINNIKLLNTKSEYFNTIKRIFSFYNIPIDDLFKTNILSTNIGKYFLDNIDNNINNLLDNIKKNFDLENETNNNIFNKIISILNNYTWIDNYSQVKELIANDLKNTYINSKLLKNKVEIVDINNNIFSDDNYYFLLGFNEGSIPKYAKDENYITDNIKENTYVDLTVDINRRKKKDIIKCLSRIKNLVITYKNKDSNMEYNKSSLVNDLNMEIKTFEKDNYGYSNIYNKLRLSIMLDDMIKYNIINKDIDTLYSTYPNVEYNTYSNKFTGIDNNSLYKYLNNKLLLSYSTIDNYNRCSFRYYINNILKLSIYEDTFMTFVGSLFHHILEISLDKEIDIKEEYQKYIIDSKKEFSIKEKFFLDMLYEELVFIINTIKEQNSYSELDKALYEENVYIDKSNNDINITFMGVIDKLLYKEYDDKTLVSIIDYKTGNNKIDLNNTIYGIGMQLPIYLYLASNIKKISNVEFCGFYLQKILNKEISKDNIHSYIELKKKNLRLQGYSNEDIDIISKFDNTYLDSRVISGLKTSSKGFYAYSKVINNEKINKLIKLVDSIIDKDIENILKGEFTINPKKIGKDNHGCEFCKFRDICFKTNNDIVNLVEYKDMEFLKEVQDA